MVIKMTKAIAEKRLFWFLKEGAEIDLSDNAQLDMYIQQVLSHGSTPDIKSLLKMIESSAITNSFNRIKNFLPKEVKMFWEDWFGDINKFREKNTQSIQ